MPNGSHQTEEEWREVEAFFEQISEPLNHFAAKFGLVIDKYYHDGEDWTFRFANPLGGSCHIQVMRTGRDSLWLALSWYLDDYDAFTRSVKYETWKDISIEPHQLSDSMERALKVILEWRLNEWTEVVGGYEYPWAQHRKEWERMAPKYPLPKIVGGS